MNNNMVKLIDLALIEDLGTPFFDATTASLFKEPMPVTTASIISKETKPVTVCGGEIVTAIYQKLSSDSVVEQHIQDGEVAAPGEVIFSITACPATILKGERTALNFLRHLSAVATLTKTYVDKLQGLPTKLLDTRKTTPGYRQLEKYAVQCGGGVNHRMGLYDAIMIKDTHVDMLGGMLAALDRLKAEKPALPVIVEVRDKAELKKVLDNNEGVVNRVLLDNMTLTELEECVVLCRGNIATESSGNITDKTIFQVAKTGVDFISVGRLTHSAGSVDLSMKILQG